MNQYTFKQNNLPFTFLLPNPIALRKTKIAYNFGISECNRVMVYGVRPPPPPQRLGEGFVRSEALTAVRERNNVLLWVRLGWTDCGERM